MDKIEHRRAFTLIELLVVIAIIGLLASIVLVSLNISRAKAKLTNAIAFSTNIYHAFGANAVLALNFEEGSGPTAFDTSLSGNSNNGTLTAGSTFSPDTYSPGSSKSSMAFNGVSGLNFSKPLGLANSNFTFAHWVKTSSGIGQMYTIGNAGGGNGYRFGLSGGAIAFLLGNGGYTEQGCGPTGINDNTWHHIVGVFDRSGGLFICYLDGKQVGTVAIGYYPNMLDDPPGVGRPVCCASSFVGLLDDVVIYSQNLSGVAVRDLYESSKQKYLTRK